MKILIASQYHYNSFKGGNEQHAHQLSLGLTSLGHQVHYLSTSVVNPEIIPYQHRQLPSISMGNQKFLKKKSLELAKVFADSSILHVFGFSPFQMQLLHLAESQIPRLFTFQADSHSSNKILNILSHTVQRLIPSNCERIIVSTNEVQKSLRKRWPKAAISHIPLMVPLHIQADKKTKLISRKKLDLKTNLVHILCVASLSTHHYYKGIDVLLHTVKKLPKSIHLHFVGDGNKRMYYERMSHKLGLSSQVTFHGKVPNVKMATWYKGVDLLVLPSTTVSEGFGLAVLEAMYCKTPCVTTTIIGPAKTYKKLNICHLSPPNSERLLAKTIQTALSSDNAQMVSRAKSWANEHTVQQMTEKTLALYESELEKFNQ